MSQIDPDSQTSVGAALMAGLKTRCGSCGKGRVFSGYLKLRSSCPNCGQDFTVADTGDGPAFFVSFLALILFSPFYFLIPLADVSLVMKVILVSLSVLATFAFCFFLLPPSKAILLNLQIRNKAEEARLDED